jgi:protein tyrosine phosphatase
MQPHQLQKFKFVVPGVLAGSKFPETAQHASEIAVAGVKTVVTLTEHAHPLSNTFADLGIVCVHIGISDFAPPNATQCMALHQILCDQTRWPVLVHCHLGAGRTGTMLAVGVLSLLYSTSPDSPHDAIRKLHADLGPAASAAAAAVLDYAKKQRSESMLTTRQTRWFTDFVGSGAAERLFRTGNRSHQ